MITIINFLNKYSQRKVEDVGAAYLIFGIFGILNYPLSYLYHILYPAANYENFSLRMIATLLCLFLALEKYWSSKFKKYLPLYWHFTVMFCLPFFGSFLLLKNNISESWLMNSVLGFFLLVIIVDWLTFLIITFIGIGLGYLSYVLIDGNDLIIKANDNSIIQAIYMYIFAIIIGGIFGSNKDKIFQQKLDNLRILSGIIAHEMRTPLASLTAITHFLENSVPQLVETYNIAKNNNLDIPNLKEKQLSNASEAHNNINIVISNNLLAIDMLLTRINNNISNISLSRDTIQNCINKAIKNYPFNAHEIKLVHLKDIVNFEVEIDEYLFLHVIYNLIKNSLYFINLAKKGQIEISTYVDKNYNYLIFKDTGKGISKEKLPYIFNKFYSNSRFGTGLGLAFCKLAMESIGGKIKCNSIEGEFTQFTIFFPKILNTT